MTANDWTRRFSLDRYTWEARLRPALLAVLPLLVIVATWLPKVWSILGGILALISTCGVMVLLSEVARFRGRQVEIKMIANNGGKFTTIFLRHRDPTVTASTKDIYHQFLSMKIGKHIPTPEEECADPRMADDFYRGAVDWLLEATRNEKRFPLVKVENISYGFRRNLCGLKVPAILITILALAINVRLTIQNFGVDDTRLWLGCALSLALLADTLIWIFVVGIPFVEDAGRSYALRLLAQCHELRGNRSVKSSPLG
jgi:hypothetical protein